MRYAEIQIPWKDLLFTDIFLKRTIFLQLYINNSARLLSAKTVHFSLVVALRGNQAEKHGDGV